MFRRPLRQCIRLASACTIGTSFRQQFRGQLLCCKGFARESAFFATLPSPAFVSLFSSTRRRAAGCAEWSEGTFEKRSRVGKDPCLCSAMDYCEWQPGSGVLSGFRVQGSFRLWRVLERSIQPTLQGSWTRRHSPSRLHGCRCGISGWKAPS